MLDSLAPFWLWLILGGVLLAAEILIMPSGFLLCIGTAACITGVVTFLFTGMSLVWELTLFSLLSVIACYGWWTFLRKRRGGVDHVDHTAALSARDRQLIGYRGVLAEPLKNGKGRLRVNDSSWPVEADVDYPAGVKVEVLNVSGITLKVKAVE